MSALHSHSLLHARHTDLSLTAPQFSVRSQLFEREFYPKPKHSLGQTLPQHSNTAMKRLSDIEGYIHGGLNE